METNQEHCEVKLNLNGEILNLFAQSKEEKSAMLEAAEVINNLSTRYRESDKTNVLSDRQIMSLVALHLTRDLLAYRKNTFMKI